MLKDKIDAIVNKTKGERLSRDLIFDGGFVKVFKEEYKLPDGRIITRECISKNNNKSAAIIITRTIDNKFIMVFQNRIDNIVSCEFPSGYIEENEDVIKGALREVREETGYVSDEAEILDEFIPNIGSENAKMYIVYVKNARKAFDQDLDDDEYINYELFDFDEIEYLVKNHYIKNSGNKLAYYHLKEILEKK